MKSPKFSGFCTSVPLMLNIPRAEIHKDRWVLFHFNLTVTVTVSTQFEVNSNYNMLQLTSIIK